MDDPQTLITDADAALSSGELDTAEHLYNQIADDTTLPRETVDYAIQRLREVRRRRKQITQPVERKKNRSTRRQEDLTESQTTPLSTDDDGSDPVPAAPLHVDGDDPAPVSPQADGSDPVPAAPLHIDGDDPVPAPLQTDSNEPVPAAPLHVADDAPTPAPPHPDGSEPVTTPPPHTEEERWEWAQQRVAELLTEAEQRQAEGSADGYLQALKLFDRILGFSDISPEQRHAVEVQRSEVTAAHAALITGQNQDTPMDEADRSGDSRTDAIQQRIQELDRQARSYLQRPTTANYKTAIELYDRILNFSNLTPDQQTAFQHQRDAAHTAYEQFRAQFGQLTTARQIQRDEEELIVTRKLLNAGVTVGPDGEELNPRFDQLLVSVRQKLLRVGRERAAQAEKQADDGTAYLDLQLLEAATASYDQAIRLIQGDEIQGQDTSSETQVAISAIKNLLVNADTEQAIREYTERRTVVAETRTAIARIRPLFDDADKLFGATRYVEAITILEKTQALMGDHLKIRLVDDLQHRARQRWEQVTLAQADQLLEKARMADSRHDYAQVEQRAGELIGLEPHLQTDALQERRQQARELLAGLRQREEHLSTLVNEAGRSRARGNLSDAERLAREALALRQGYGPAHEVLNGVLYTLVKATLRSAEEALSAPTDERLQNSRDALEKQRNHVGEISDARRQKKLTEDIEGTLARVKRKIDELVQRRATQERARNLVDKASNLALEDRYSEALETLVEARELDRANPHIDEKETEIRADWAGFLKRRASEFMDAVPSNPGAALQYLDTLRVHGMEDVASVELRRRAEQLASKEQGLRMFDQGDFVATIEVFKQADLNDQEVRSTLREARRREAQRLMHRSCWSEALEVLHQVDSGEQGFPALMSRARAELLLEQAQTHLQEKVFDSARTVLNDAEREPLGDLPGRIQALREEIERAEATFRRVQSLQQDAESQYQRYQSHKNRDDLLAAIRTLHTALVLPELRAGDSLRNIVQQRHDELQRLYERDVTTERDRLLAEAEQSLNEDRLDTLRDARRWYTAVLELAPNRQDAEATAGLNRVQKQVRAVRDKLIEETQVLLNMRNAQTRQRGIRPEDTRTLMARLEEAQQLDAEQHRGMNEALPALREAWRACNAAETDLHAARTRWVAARQAGSLEFRDAELDLQRALQHFEGRPYTHVELDHNSLESLARRMTTDREAQVQIANSVTAIRNALERDDSAAVIAEFAELDRAEETIYTTTVSLAERIATVTVPRTPAERSPHQYRLLRGIAEEITTLQQRERDAPNIQTLRDILQRRSALQRLLETLDSDNRFGLC